jgi:O-antigen ligase
VALGTGTAPVQLVRSQGWDPLLIVVSVYILVAVSYIQLLFPFLLPLRLGLTTAAGAVVLLLVDPSPQRRLGRLNEPVSRGVVALLLWATLTIPLALHAGLAYQFVTQSLWKVVVLYVVIVGCIRSLRDVERLSLVYLAGIVAYCLYVYLYAPRPTAGARIDVSGSYDPNDFATFAVTGAPFALFFTGRHHPLWIRLSAVAGMAAIAVSVVLTGSRGGMLAFLAVIAYFLIGYRSIPLRWRVTGVALVVAVALGTGSEEYWERMRTLLHPSEDYNTTSEVGRIEIWKRGLGYFARRPLTGVGINNFGMAEGTISPLASRQQLGVGVAWLAPHNSYLQIMAELGLPGILLLLTMIYRGFRALSTGSAVMAPISPTARPLGQALTASMIGLLVGVFFLSHAYSSMLYTLFALVAGYAKSAQLIAAPAAVQPRRRRSW